MTMEREGTQGAGIDHGKGDKIHGPFRSGIATPTLPTRYSTRYIRRYPHGLSLDLITESYDAVRELLD